MVRLIVDGKEIMADGGNTLLRACLDNGIYIPNLCYLEGMEHAPASCRLCLVEVEGERGPVTACTVTLRQGLVVKTDTPLVRRLQRSALRLLLSAHRVECASCPANKKCELQRIARFLKVGLKPKGLEPFLKEPEVVKEHPLLDYYPNRCVLCGRCIHICRKENPRPHLSLAHRGMKTVVTFFGDEDSTKLPCIQCSACVSVCPTGALTLRQNHVQPAENAGQEYPGPD
ncbi:MAG: (2Fe-2S)-binding protein [Deltaproteobacteria bacterium]|nr:(2Fe-2S)-binding protein [Deltaproteobacteria bacterium]